MTPQPFPLAWRLALLIGFSILLTAAGAGALIFQILEESTMYEAEHGAERFSHALRGAARYAMLRNRREDLAEIIRAAGSETGVEAVRIINKAGEIVFSSREGEAGSRLDLEAEACVTCHAAGEPLVAPRRPRRIRVFEAPGTEHRNIGFITPIYNEPSCSDASCHAHPASRKVLGVIDIQVSIADIDDRMTTARRTLAIALALWSPLLAIVFGLGGHLLVSRPVKRLAAACRALAEKGPEQARELPVGGAAEIRSLSGAFNVMHARLRDAHRLMLARITDGTIKLRDAEEQILRREKLSAVGALAAGIAHEVNNPITGIITFAHLLLREAAADTPEATKLKRIIEEAERCGQIVRNFLAFSRPGGSKERVDPRKVVLSVISLLEPQPRFATCRVTPRFAPDLTSLHTCAGDLQQILSNLIRNAAEAGARQITVEVSSGREGKQHEFTVEDDGPGISLDVLPRIFDPFFTTKDAGQGQGAGLGLWISYRLATDLGGTIVAGNRREGGARFRLTLPAGDENQPDRA